VITVGHNITILFENVTIYALYVNEDYLLRLSMEQTKYFVSYLSTITVVGADSYFTIFNKIIDIKISTHDLFLE
jgi:hypothetical protein